MDLNEGQIKNIIKAARGVKGACPKAVKFVNDLLPVKKSKKAVKRIKKQSTDSDYPSLELLEKYGKKFLWRVVKKW